MRAVFPHPIPCQTPPAATTTTTRQETYYEDKIKIKEDRIKIKQQNRITNIKTKIYKYSIRRYSLRDDAITSPYLADKMRTCGTHAAWRKN